MAKFVIAGSANCPYLAKIELLGDELTRNLPNFKLHKIVVQPNEWQSWLENLCNERGWKKHDSKSPIVWRELVDRGGKGMLVGGANEFQEYAQSYYGIKSDHSSDHMQAVAKENLSAKIEIDAEEAEFRAQSTPLHVCISNAASGVAYGLINSICRGDCLGEDVEISLRLYDSDPEKAGFLEGVQMETIDLAHPLLRKIQVTSDPEKAFEDASIIILLDEVERLKEKKNEAGEIEEEEETQESWLQRNHKHFSKLAEVIDSAAKPDAKVILGGQGPINFNIRMMLDQMSKAAEKNVVGVARTLENHAKAVIAQKLVVNSAGVVDVIVWGNINGKHIIDISKSRVHNYEGAVCGPPSFSVSVPEMIHDDKWVNPAGGEFVTAVETRRVALETALRHRPSNTESAAVATLLQHWWLGAPQEQCFSLAVASEGDYDIPDGLVCSLPVRFSKEDGWTLVKDLEVTDDHKELMKAVIADLQEETYAVYPRPKPPTPPPEPVSVIVEEPQEEANAVSAASPDQQVAGAKPEDTAEEAQSDTQPEQTAEEIDLLEKITEDKEGEEQEATK